MHWALPRTTYGQSHVNYLLFQTPEVAANGEITSTMCMAVHLCKKLVFYTTYRALPCHVFFAMYAKNLKFYLVFSDVRQTCPWEGVGRG